MPATHILKYLGLFTVLLSVPLNANGRRPAFVAPMRAQLAARQVPFPTGGSPLPVSPPVISRDASGQLTIRAHRLATPLDIDGHLDEAVYAAVPPMSDFIQTEPAEGAPASEKTEVWILFDDEHVSIIGRCWETHPERVVANEMRRDNFGVVRNDNFPWSFDTFAFYDNLNINTYWATTHTSGLGRDDLSYRAQVDYAGDRFGVQVEQLAVGTDVNPEVGFLRREDFERSFGSFRFSPRPQGIAVVRKLSWEGRFDCITNRAGVLETRQAQGRFGIELFVVYNEQRDTLAPRFHSVENRAFVIKVNRLFRF